MGTISIDFTSFIVGLGFIFSSLGSQADFDVLYYYCILIITVVTVLRLRVTCIEVYESIDTSLVYVCLIINSST